MKQLPDGSRLRLIIAREFQALVFTKTFIAMSLLMPIVMLAAIFLPIVLAEVGTGGHEHVAVVDETGRYFSSLEADEEFDFENITALGRSGMQTFFEASENTYAVVVIPADVDSSLHVTVYSNTAVRHSLTDRLSECLRQAVGRTRIESYDIPELRQVIAECQVSIDVGSVQWSDEGEEKESSQDLAIILGLVLALFAYIFTLSYGALVMSRVVEEKTNRIVEVIVSSCRPIELMLGKIIGVGFAGLTQIMIWAIVGSILLLLVGTGLGIGAMATGSIDTMVASLTSTPAEAIDTTQLLEMALNVDYPQIAICFLLYFVGGYLLYASMFAALGSAVDQQSDTSLLMYPMLILMMIALMVGMGCVENPDGNLAMWGSMVPFTSPIVMMVRLPYDVPWWQIVISLILLYFTALATTTLAARIYRTAILVYGSKPSLRTLLRWMK